MSPATYQTVPLTCPKCQYRYVTPVLMTIDAGESPEAKALLLSGQVNVAVCPQCGYAGMLNTPMVYHDASHELLFTFVPTNTGVTDLERQRLVGELTNRLISNLPAEKRKGYLLNPRSFLRMESMIEAILEADGITPEMLEVQRARAALLGRLLRTPSEKSRQAIARENDAQIDYEFLQLLALNLEMAQAGGQAEAAQQLAALQSELLEWTTHGRELAARQEAIESLGTGVTRESLLEKLVAAALAGEQVKVETLVAIARPAIDYTFYQQLTSRIEAAEQAGKADEAQKLRALRDSVLDLTAEIDAEVEQATQKATQFLQKVLDSPDPEQEIRGHPGQVDELFMGLVQANLQAAEKAGQAEAVRRLRQVAAIITNLVLESQPPEVQFVNELLAADYPEGTEALLAAHREEVDQELVEFMRLLGEDLAGNGRDEVAQRLTLIRQQAATLIR